MKKIITTAFLTIFLSIITYAQVIDLQGIGMVNKPSETLIFSDHDNIDHVTVFSIFKAPEGNTPVGDVTFQGGGQGPSSTWMDETNIEDYNFSSADPEIGYWTEDFSTVDGGGIDAIVSDPGPTDDGMYIRSYYAYIFRTVPGATYTSYYDMQTVFFYINGSNNPYVYDIEIDPASGPRDITVKIPISELTDDQRTVVFDITAGPVSLPTQVENIYNNDDSFFLGTYTLNEVPGDVEHVFVSIYSPSVADDGEEGDSFFVNGIVADVENVPDGGCTYTQGYWKTHSIYGPAPYDDTWASIGEDTPFFLSGQSYYEVIWTKPKGNAYYILAHQYIAAELNFIAGADPSDAQAAFDDATDLFNNYSPADIKGLKGNNPLRQEFIDLGGILDDYNKGDIGPGHCEDEGEKSTIANMNPSDENLLIYPNPVSGYGSIDFTTSEASNTTVELYNLLGSRVDVLYNAYMDAGTTINLRIDANKYQKGMYIIFIKNGSSVYKEKLTVTN